VPSAPSAAARCAPRWTHCSAPARLDPVRTSLAAHPWLRGLWKPGDDGDRIQRYMNDGTIIDGVPLRVIELTGEPGDVILMHSDTFHAAAPNRLTEPRMMLTEIISPQPN
jgi:hypothetical protein